jgi:hypothetical protein
MTDQQNVDRAAQIEELRFAKKQQWAITTSAVTLLGAPAQSWRPRPSRQSMLTGSSKAFPYQTTISA